MNHTLDHVRWGAILWMMTASFFVAQFWSQSEWLGPAFSLVRYDISLLGITSCDVFRAASMGETATLCSPLHTVFNAGVILHGALVVFGVWLTQSIWPATRSANFGLLLLGLSGMGAMIVGAYPLDANLAFHIMGAVMAIVLPGLGFLLLAAATRDTHRTIALLTAFTGIVVLLGGLGHAFNGMGFGRGTMERLAVWPQTLWYMVVGTTVLINLSKSRMSSIGQASFR